MGVASAEESLLLRTLTPVLKFFTAKKAMEIVSEGLECFGGQGYIEDTGLPLHLRDAQVMVKSLQQSFTFHMLFKKLRWQNVSGHVKIS